MSASSRQPNQGSGGGSDESLSELSQDMAETAEETLQDLRTPAPVDLNPTVGPSDPTSHELGCVFFESLLDDDTLANALLQTGGVKYTPDNSGALMANTAGGGVPAWAKRGPLSHCLKDIEELTGLNVKHVNLIELMPGVVLPWHTDEDHGQRWHLPLYTAEGALFEYEHGYGVHMQCGFWWLVDPTQSHRALNLASSSRIHLVCDLG